MPKPKMTTLELIASAVFMGSVAAIWAKSEGETNRIRRKLYNNRFLQDNDNLNDDERETLESLQLFERNIQNYANVVSNEMVSGQYDVETKGKEFRLISSILPTQTEYNFNSSK